MILIYSIKTQSVSALEYRVASVTRYEVKNSRVEALDLKAIKPLG